MDAEARKYKKYLVMLTKSVRVYLEIMDELMRLPSNVEKGRRIAKLSNDLEMANDRARYFGLGIDYRKDKKGRGTKA